MNTTGSAQTTARFSASWNAPMLVAPSPKKHTVTWPVPRYWAEQLGHDQCHLRAAGEHVVVPAVADERVVVRAHRGRHAGRDRLLSHAQVGGPLDQVLQEQVVRALLELPDPGHGPVHPECGLLIHGAGPQYGLVTNSSLEGNFVMISIPPSTTTTSSSSRAAETPSLA